MATKVANVTVDVIPSDCLLNAVAALKTERDDLHYLCNEMVETLTMDRNQWCISERLQKQSAEWKQTFESIGKRAALAAKQEARP